MNSSEKPKTFDEKLLRAMKDPEEAIGYLNAALELKDETKFRLVLHYFIEAQGGAGPFGKRTDIDAHELYRMLYTRGHIRLEHLMEIGRVFGHRLTYERIRAKQPKNNNRSWEIEERRINTIVDRLEINWTTMVNLPISIFEGEISPAVQKRLEKGGIRLLRDLALRDRKTVMKSCRINQNEDIEMERASNIFSFIVWNRARDRSWRLFMIKFVGKFGSHSVKNKEMCKL